MRDLPPGVWVCEKFVCWEANLSESTLVERIVGDVKVVIDRSLCVGFAQCLDVSDVAFRLGDDDIVEFEAPAEVDRETLLAACKACPVEALRVLDHNGAQIVP
jgi:ferredoxin